MSTYSNNTSHNHGNDTLDQQIRPEHTHRRDTNARLGSTVTSTQTGEDDGSRHTLRVRMQWPRTIAPKNGAYTGQRSRLIFSVIVRFGGKALEARTARGSRWLPPPPNATGRLGRYPRDFRLEMPSHILIEAGLGRPSA